MPGVDRECVTHHACDCIQAKADRTEEAEAQRDRIKEAGNVLADATEALLQRTSVTARQVREALAAYRNATQEGS